MTQSKSIKCSVNLSVFFFAVLHTLKIKKKKYITTIILTKDIYIFFKDKHRQNGLLIKELFAVN